MWMKKIMNNLKCKPSYASEEEDWNSYNQEEKEVKKIELLKTRLLIVDNFDRDLFAFMIEKAVVNADDSITFMFRNGNKLTIHCKE